MDHNEQAVQLMQARLIEIEGEIRRLTSALEELAPTPSPRSARGSGTRPVKRTPNASKPRSRKRAPRGERGRQLLAAIKRMPGASPIELADALGISSSQTHVLIRKAVAKGEILARGQGYTVTGAS
jgi:hypothetical protein